jgi:aryl-alcohol dehydrogenase-like predicted oxidoreductase
LGTVKLGRNTAVKYEHPFALPDDETVAQLLHQALALGVTLFDTAPAYGVSEQRLAPFLAQHRDRIVLCTKAGEQFDGTTSTHDFTPAAIERSVHTSLARLGVTQLDILLLHSDGRDEAVLATPGLLPLLARFKATGTVRAIGISAKTASGIMRAIADGLDVVMTGFSRTDPARGAALAAAHAAGLGTLAIKALDSGRAADPVSAARWVQAQGYIDSVIVGTLTPAHLEPIANALASPMA